MKSQINILQIDGLTQQVEHNQDKLLLYAMDVGQGTAIIIENTTTGGSKEKSEQNRKEYRHKSRILCMVIKCCKIEHLLMK